ncbi:hypothetical protein GCM10023081_04060 [Arthrobacter ginkgonis]|uniref:Uncharacterized protein n=1 Tax=Arthrobacter ginkgonis TaxID=1630594 RepID=A0ABP7BVH4_9MICC
MKNRPRPTRLRALAAAVALAATPLALVPAPAVAAEDEAHQVKGVFHQDEPGEVVYEAVTPEDWNGTLVLDLDFNRWTGEKREWFLSHGYGIGGIQRTQNQTAYEIKKYVDDLVATRGELMEAGTEEPARTIAVGASRGGFVARMSVEHRPDVFDGALAFAGGGAGVLGSWLSKADAVWALKTLVDPAAPLAINNLPDIPAGASYGPDYQQDVALAALVEKARGDDAGTARLMLASALEQATAWPSGAEAPGANDFEDQAQRIADSFAWANPQFVHKEIEDMAGGPVVWNHGVDYAALLEDSGAIERVRYWYDKAGLDVEDDLARLAGAPRYSADAAAIGTLDEKGTFTGDTGQRPVLSIKTIGDGADAVPLDAAYVQTFAAAGSSAQLRTAFIGRAGHSTQTFREYLAAFATLESRIGTGVWPATSAAALNERAATVEGVGVGPAPANFIEHSDAAPLRTWDFTNRHSYLSLYADDLAAGRAPDLANGLRNAAKHLNAGRLKQACGALGSVAEKVPGNRALSPAQERELGGQIDAFGGSVGCPLS